MTGARTTVGSNVVSESLVTMARDESEYCTHVSIIAGNALVSRVVVQFFKQSVAILCPNGILKPIQSAPDKKASLHTHGRDESIASMQNMFAWHGAAQIFDQSSVDVPLHPWRLCRMAMAREGGGCMYVPPHLANFAKTR